MNNEPKGDECISFFLPVREGSKRVLSKSTRSFAGVTDGLLGIKLRQLLRSKRIHEVVLSTNDETAISIASGMNTAGSQVRLRVIRRPNHLCLDTTNLVDLIDYVPTIISSPHILWGHVTTPFADELIYDRAIDTYLGARAEGHDSLVSVLRFQNFLIDPDSNTLLNTTKTHNTNKATHWPRTQDLQELYEVNHAVFLTSREVYTERHDRIGVAPNYFAMDKLQSFDIDWPEDFQIAEAIYKSRPK